MTYNADGNLATLTACNPTTGDQVTRYEYGVTPDNSALASNLLLRSTLYPDAGDGEDRVVQSYNRQGQVTGRTDQNGTVRRNMAGARRQGAGPEALANGDVTVPRSGQAWFFTKKHPARAERWKQYRVERELSKYPVIDPETGEIIQPSVVSNFKPMGRKRREDRDS